jgi:hypothetical protein
MNYQEARRLRNLPSLTELIRQKALLGESAGGAVMSSLREKYGISTRMKARSMAIKEKFDPMNIIKFMTGGSKTAAALYGRFAGRSQEDIEYFAGRAQQQEPTYRRIGRISNNEGILPILEKMHGFLYNVYAQELKRKDKENDFNEERKVEDERRHKELLKALGSMPGSPIPMKMEEKDDKGLLAQLAAMLGIVFGKIKGMISGLISTIANIAEQFGKLMKALKVGRLWRVLSWFASPFGLKLLAIAGIAGLLAWMSDNLRDWIKNNMPDYSKLDPIEAKSLLLRAEPEEQQRYLEKYKNQFKNMDEVRSFVQLAEETARQKLEDPNLPEKDRKKYQELLDLQPISSTPRSVPPRPDTTDGKNKARAENWDRKFGQTHNWDGSPKNMTPGQQALPQGVNPSEVDGRGGSIQYDDYIRSQTPQGAAFGVYPGTGQRAAPVSTAPNVSETINDNQFTRTMSSYMPYTVTAIDKSPELRAPDRTSDALRIMPAVRNLDATFQRMIYNSVRVV